jgi:hypothetical protein
MLLGAVRTLFTISCTVFGAKPLATIASRTITCVVLPILRTEI